MLLFNGVISALLNLILLVLLPLFGYGMFHRLRHQRRARDVVQRLGLRVGKTKYIWGCIALSLLLVVALSIWPPSLEVFSRKGSPQAAFVGLGLNSTSVLLALLYGVVQTGFAEEFLFRGMIAGSLARRLPLTWANLLQAVIFLLPHFLILLVMPEMWVILPLVFLFSLIAGWVRIRSESILGPWILHATANVTVCLSVAVRRVVA